MKEMVSKLKQGCSLFEKNIVQVFIEKVLFLEDEIKIVLKFGGREEEVDKGMRKHAVRLLEQSDPQPSRQELKTIRPEDVRLERKTPKEIIKLI
ncbi:hypothetical protein QJ48_07695 [Paenibacillus sp. A3]|uniref:hypothetical protein n=1 Tax=Paenibacillus sp. A3 TaxID=1337054 RepID=UPI0006D53BB0|nr:hypothetical protein [Paenibacillus sp. A3]KPV60029.1 hypothetical protein QJ48_07695 [Paenibacillus sp. A3]